MHGAPLDHSPYSRSMATTIVPPRDSALRHALYLAMIFGAVKLLLHVATNLWQTRLGYGYFRDEMYYIVCGRRLAWGYVDHGPLVAVQARLAETLFGTSLTGIRMLSALAGAGRVLLTGILAWALGGRRPAQALAMTGVLASPQFLSIDSYLSMNSVESLFWMGCLLTLMLILRGGSQRLWLVFGGLAGFGLLNKPSMAFFLFALVIGLLLLPQRRLLASRPAAAGAGVMLLIVLPYLRWQVQHHWPTLEFLLNARHEHKVPPLSPILFVTFQILYHDPLTMLVWGAGLLWLLFHKEARQWRFLGVSFVLFIDLMIVLHGNHYYASPVYPILFAAGGVAWERFLSGRTAPLVLGLMEAAMVAVAAVSLPWGIPVLAPKPWLHYMKATHLYALSISRRGQMENHLPLFFADRFSWEQEVAIVTRAYNSLPLEDRAKVAIITGNYGEASAIDFLGQLQHAGLPPAISTSNNYFLWGPRGASGELLIAVSPQQPNVLRPYYRSVEIVGPMDEPWAQDNEHLNIYLLRGRKKNLAEDWPNLKNYF